MAQLRPAARDPTRRQQSADAVGDYRGWCTEQLRNQPRAFNPILERLLSFSKVSTFVSVVPSYSHQSVFDNDDQSCLFRFFLSDFFNLGSLFSFGELAYDYYDPTHN